MRALQLRRTNLTFAPRLTFRMKPSAPAQLPIPVPEELRNAVGADTSGSTSIPALVQPDHTTFHSKGGLHAWPDRDSCTAAVVQDLRIGSYRITPRHVTPRHTNLAAAACRRGLA
jgi:hypothetical protein